jgi:hypothetical protein
MEANQKASMKGKTFVEDMKSVFLSYIAQIRSKRGIEQEEAELSIDKCPSHLANEAMDMLTTARMSIVNLA